jgi:signal transduction histidine kinase
MAKGLIGPLTPDQAQFLDTIVRNTERMQILVSDVQDITKLETHQMKLDVRATSAVDALEAALQAIQPQTEAQTQQVTLEIEDDLPQVQADPKRLEQIVTELLRNASKYTPSAGQISVQADHHNATVRFRIADTGIGISPEDQDRLFVKFFRSDNPAVRNRSGTGLGLCVVKGLVELQGGEFRIDSELDQGTTCTFTMPLATTALEEVGPLS